MKEGSIAMVGRSARGEVAVGECKGRKARCAHANSQPSSCKPPDNLDVQRRVEDNEGNPAAPPSRTRAVPDPRVLKAAHTAEGAKESGVKCPEFLNTDDVDAKCVTQGEDVLVT